jgi:hypothetical protein
MMQKELVVNEMWSEAMEAEYEKESAGFHEAASLLALRRRGMEDVMRAVGIRIPTKREWLEKRIASNG